MKQTTETQVKRRNISLLLVILISYFVVGFPDGSFTVSWLGMYDDGLIGAIAHTGYILVAYSVLYTLAGVILAWLTRFFKLQTIYLGGLVVMTLGFIGLAFSINFAMILIFIAIYGFGTGAMASSMNSYMAKHFTARHNNWMHCFWGGGATVSPLIMGHMMNIADWRRGYLVIVGILAIVVIFLLISMYKKMWIDGGATDLPQNTVETVAKKRYLVKKWHQIVKVLTFFFLGGTDYTLVFFTGAALMARGVSGEDVALFSAAYYVCMTIGRVFFGWIAKWIRGVLIVRIGCLLALIGIGMLYFTSNIVGMAITGLGLAPLLPTLVSDTSNHFAPRTISKLVGYELATFGAGIAVLFFLTSLLLEHISLEMLFPLGIGFVILVFLCNEILEQAVTRDSSTANKARR